MPRVLYLIRSHPLEDMVVKAFVLTLDPGARRELTMTDGDEFLFALKGTTELVLADEPVRLEEGDSLFFNGRIPHVPRNVGEGPAVLLVLYFLKRQP